MHYLTEETLDGLRPRESHIRPYRAEKSGEGLCSYRNQVMEIGERSERRAPMRQSQKKALSDLS
jgi:hypothetical protein